jgi:hypothetical protein
MDPEIETLRFLTIFGEKIGVLKNQCYDQNFA